MNIVCLSSQENSSDSSSDSRCSPSNSNTTATPKALKATVKAPAMVSVALTVPKAKSADEQVMSDYE